MTDQNLIVSSAETLPDDDEEILQACNFGDLCESCIEYYGGLKISLASNNFTRLLGICETKEFQEWLWDRYYEDDLGDTDIELGLIVATFERMGSLSDAFPFAYRKVEFIPLGESSRVDDDDQDDDKYVHLAIGYYAGDPDEGRDDFDDLLKRCRVEKELTVCNVSGSSPEHTCGHSRAELETMFDRTRRDQLAYCNTEDQLEPDDRLEDLMLSDVPADVGRRCPAILGTCGEEFGPDVDFADNEFIRMLGADGRMTGRKFVDNVLKSEDADFEEYDYGMIVAYKCEGESPYWHVDSVACGAKPRDGALTVGWYKSSSNDCNYEGEVFFAEWCDLLAAWLTRCVGNTPLSKEVLRSAKPNSSKFNWERATKRFAAMR